MSAPAASQRPDKRAARRLSGRLQLASRGWFASLRRPHGCREAVRRQVAMAGTLSSRWCDRCWAKEALCSAGLCEIWFLALNDILESGHMKGRSLALPR